jgi:hypothetical protein
MVWGVFRPFATLTMAPLLVVSVGCAVGVGNADDGHASDAGADHVTRLDGGPIVVDGAPGGNDTGTPDAGTADTGTPDGGLPAVSCDPKFTAATVVSTVAFDVGFTDNVGWVYIGLDVSGAGSPKAQLTNITGNFTWHFHITGHAVGKLRMIFTKDNGTKVATCDLWVQ